ncbi:DUF5050 domain-containing protein [Paenibacillus monticola]|uniref:DUF5050 domain-containing protein n=1 Tax=Paenibacillus monticola TaxID=2666075 RepID=A0A7X2L021_9BACL|nr:DUF5050 domain-containing protein [Paenibacillus monticola]MRN52312.1 DUF5050 domain-containing protein [Paenibacillus monticola]
MERSRLYLKRTGFALLIIALAVIGITGGGIQPKVASAAASVEGYVYYVTDSDLYRVRTDGGTAQKISEDFEGTGLESSGNYLYFTYDENSTDLQRLSLTDPDALITSVGGDKKIINYKLDGGFLYFMDDQGSIYRSLANTENDEEATLIADSANPEYPDFTIVGNRIYYNALKDGSTSWVTSKAKDGSGVVQWIAKGVIPNTNYAHMNSTNLYLLVNTQPEETQYSRNCMVLYTLSLNGGSPKAINAKTPLDLNSAYSGMWASDYYLINKGMVLGANDDYDYSKAKGFLMDKNGKTFQLSQTGVKDIADLGGNKFAYVDAKNKTYVSTIANGKVTTTKALALSNADLVLTLNNGDKIGSAVFFSSTGAYVLNANLTLTKMIGVNWDNVAFTDNIPSIYYVNAGDHDNLYRMNADGKTTLKLSSVPTESIPLVSSK